MAGMRKFFGGLLAGAAVAALSLGFVSQLSGPQAGVAVTPTLGGVTADPTAGAKVAPAAVVVAAPVSADPIPAAPAQPEVAVVATAPDAPVQGKAVPTAEAAPAVTATAEAAPALNATPAEAPAPEAAPDATLAQKAAPPLRPLTEAPAAQAAPVIAEAEAALAPVAEQTATLSTSGPATPATPVPDAAPMAADLPPPPPLTAEEQALLTQLEIELPKAEVAPAAIDEAPAAAQEPVVDAAPVPTPEAPAVAPTPSAEPVVVAIAPEAEPQPEVIAVQDTPERLVPDAPIVTPSPKTLPPTPRLITAGEGTIIDRTARPNAAAPAAEALPEVTLADARPLARYAAAFDNPDAKPLFSIVLIDSGEAAIDRQALANLPFPISVVVDPLSPNAATNAALYRAAGKEVIMLATGIPEGATPADLEQTFQAHATALPEAVAVIDTEAASFQNDRALSTQLVPILAAQGRGLLTWDRGLNAADQVARREGLPATVIFRRIDGAGEAAPVIRRYLDRAAFKAAQEGRVTVIGQVRPETIAALLEWAIEGRASTVALAPISAQLQGQ
jgi:uncharacterized protein